MLSLIREAIKRQMEKTQYNIFFTALFGSYRRGDYDAFSDIDLLIIHEDESERPTILNDLKSLEHILGKRIHANLFEIREFERRVRLHDYLLTSMIRDSSLIYGGREVFNKAEKDIEKQPSDEALKFNRQMGLEMLNRALSFLDEGKMADSSTEKMSWLIRGLNNYRLALGYLHASDLMRRSQEGISYADLTKTAVGSTLKEIANMERALKRGMKIDQRILYRFIERQKRSV
ncbi:nucleotidyltransferase domain-containing protein [Candidatus Bathyarchaeota archaeon]|nr:MAG: nucleotidyltransferase domain-containing protein [Candidatus Bathyarchaeota archaeon]